MNLTELQADDKTLLKANNHRRLCKMIKVQVRSLNKTVSKKDKMPFKQEKMALDRILSNLNINDDKKIRRNVHHIYKDLYLTNLGKVRYLSFNLNKASKKLGISTHKPNIMNIAHNVLIHRFGLGVHPEILAVHSNIISIDNTPVINIIIKYL